MYIVMAQAVQLHGPLAIHVCESKAIRTAQTFAANDADDYHTYSVYRLGWGVVPDTRKGYISHTNVDPLEEIEPTYTCRQAGGKRSLRPMGGKNAELIPRSIA